MTSQPLKVLEWGCGPARVIRHIGGFLTRPAELWGSDYNPRSIRWCRRHIANERFVHNGLAPPLPLEAGSFDAVYCLSVFTHLSEAMHVAWRDELLRVLRPGGILIATLHGDHYRDRHLLPHEMDEYDGGRLVVRDAVQEGKKWYAAFHSPRYVREHLFKGLPILLHRPQPLPGCLEQDVWVVHKPG